MAPGAPWIISEHAFPLGLITDQPPNREAMHTTQRLHVLWGRSYRVAINEQNKKRQQRRLPYPIFLRRTDLILTRHLAVTRDHLAVKRGQKASGSCERHASWQEG